ncbi:phage regulatory CII family protein [Herminiimonas sp. CN]|uniref:phage regulatory CII family protein n=1 Tax=Herminiimonas sp. CN TaxID=1349818 RepID=UPI000473A6F4|nr:phage regulatory CII family protein [Herminiimonas sp. CN]
MSHKIPCPTDVHEAFRAVVHDYDVAQMAAKLGMPAGTLYNKANLNESSAHKPTLADAVLVQVIASDTRIVEAMAHTLGGVFVKLPTVQAISDVALLEMVADISIKNGQFHGELKEALEDGKFSRDEHAAIHQRALIYITSILETVSRIEGMVDA